MSVFNKKSVVAMAAATAVLFSLPGLAHEHGGKERGDGYKDRKEHRMAMRHERMEEFMMSKVDTNQDGNIDEAEFMQHAQQRFEMMDINSDGVVTPEERKEAGDAMREKHREAMKAAREAYKENKE